MKPGLPQPSLQSLNLAHVGRSIGFTTPRANAPGLKEFLCDVHPGEDPNEVLTIEFWQTALIVLSPTVVSYTTLAIELI